MGAENYIIAYWFHTLASFIIFTHFQLGYLIQQIEYKIIMLNFNINEVTKDYITIHIVNLFVKKLN